MIPFSQAFWRQWPYSGRAW